ncbi:hypothetical protein OIO90_005284 [Microbotryomycetes sp. JL221]|nr:hypothetical protein OIO90_005284 [Microbotryomycetes sp. JL221]
MPASTIFITGANRGLGLGMTKILLKRGHNVIAAARNPEAATDFKELKKQYPQSFDTVVLDVAETNSVNDAAAAVAKNPLAKDGIDVLINNAGAMQGSFYNGLYGSQSDPIEDLRSTFEVNVYGVVRVNNAFLPLLRKKTSGKKQIIVISSAGGSISTPFAKMPIVSIYATSKSAANMLVLKSHGELEKEGIAIVSYYPGVVETDMAKDADPKAFEGLEKLTVEQAAEKASDVFEKLETGDSAKFLSYDGSELPW